MGNVLRVGYGSANVILRGFPSLRECVITRIEELAFLCHLHKMILMSRKFTIFGEELLLLGRQFAEVNLVALSREHDE